MKISKYIIPILVILTIIGGYNLRHAFTMPSTSTVYAEGDGIEESFIISGLRCKGTAEFFASLYDSTNGILSITTYASEYEAIIKYDPEMITQDSIVAIMEQPFEFNDGSEGQAFECLEIN